MTADPAATSPHPLIARLFDARGFARVDPANLEAFAGESGEAVLFLSEDPARYRETLDMAVILPEILAASAKPFRVGVALPEHSREIARRYGVRLWPALVYLRGGEFLGTIEGLREWSDFVAQSDRLLRGPAQPLPPKVIALAAGHAPGCA